MSAWFALVEGRYEQLIEFAQAGQSIAGLAAQGFSSSCKKRKAGHGSVITSRPTQP
jgi:hypothetical protein